MIGTANANSIKIAPLECSPSGLPPPLPRQNIFTFFKKHEIIPSISYDHSSDPTKDPQGRTPQKLSVSI